MYRRAGSLPERIAAGAAGALLFYASNTADVAGGVLFVLAVPPRTRCVCAGDSQ